MGVIFGADDTQLIQALQDAGIGLSGELIHVAGGLVGLAMGAYLIFKGIRWTKRFLDGEELFQK